MAFKFVKSCIGLGQYTAFELLATLTTTSLEMVQMFLDLCSVVEDVNLYSIHQVTRSVEGTKGIIQITFLCRCVL